MRMRALCCIVTGLILAGQSLRAHQPHDPMVTVAASPNFANDHRVLAATDALSIKIGIFLVLKSTDGGATWAPVSGLPSNTRMAAIVFSPAYSQDQTIHRRTNQGTSWSLLNTAQLQSVALSPNFVTDGTLTVWEQHGIVCGVHTLTITALLAPGQSASLDAFDVWVDTFGWTLAR